MKEFYTLYEGYENPVEIGLLTYDQDSDKFSMFVDSAIINKRMYPILFGLDGEHNPDDRRIRIWIDSRTTTPDRVGIESILAALDLDHYDGWEILKAANGRNPGCDRWSFIQTAEPNPKYLQAN